MKRLCVVPIVAKWPGVTSDQIKLLAMDTLQSLPEDLAQHGDVGLVVADGTGGRAATWMRQAFRVRAPVSKLASGAVWERLRYIRGPWRDEPALIRAAARQIACESVLVVRPGATLDGSAKELWARAEHHGIAWGRVHASHPIYGEIDYGHPLPDPAARPMGGAFDGQFQFMRCPVPPVCALSRAQAVDLGDYPGFYLYDAAIRIRKAGRTPFYLDESVGKSRFIFPRHGEAWSEGESLKVHKEWNVFAPTEEPLENIVEELSCKK